MRVWICPYCKYKITDLQYLYARYDYGCPRCKCSFMKFKSVEEKPHNCPEEEKKDENH